MKDKPIVYFGKIIGWKGLVSDEGRMRVVLADVTGHPILGDQPVVNTSVVMRVDRGDPVPPFDYGEIREIETLNTVYRKRGVTE